MINSRKKGFTIVELVIVVAVIAILAAVLIPTFSNLVKKANESADIQALTTMNKYLALESAEDDLKELMDVYRALDEYDIKAETYTPLYKGRYYFYDSSINKILYVDEDYKVIAPKECLDIVRNDNWRSLNGELKEIEVSKTESNGVTVYNVNSAEELNYVTNNFDPTGNTKVVLTNDINLYGSSVSFDKPITGTLEITASSEVTISNFVGYNQYNSVSKSSDGTMRSYNSGFIGNVSGENSNLIITNITFDNFVIEAFKIGNVGIVAGSVTGAGKFTNVVVSNSKVYGNRNVGAMIGMCYVPSIFGEGCEIINTEVKTSSGRSGIIGVWTSNKAEQVIPYIKNIKIENSHCTIWEETKTASFNQTGFSGYNSENNPNVTFTAYQKYDFKGYYLHADNVLMWTNDTLGSSTFTVSNGDTDKTYYAIFANDIK